jgi:hypothetical protein
MCIIYCVFIVDFAFRLNSAYYLIHSKLFSLNDCFSLTALFNFFLQSVSDYCSIIVQDSDPGNVFQIF